MGLLDEVKKKTGAAISTTIDEAKKGMKEAQEKQEEIKKQEEQIKKQEEEITKQEQDVLIKKLGTDKMLELRPSEVYWDKSMILFDTKDSFEGDLAFQYIERIHRYFSSLEISSIESTKGRLNIGGSSFLGISSGTPNIIPAIQISINEGPGKGVLSGDYFILTDGNTHSINFAKSVNAYSSDKDITPTALVDKVKSSLGTIEARLVFGRFDSLLEMAFDSAIEAINKDM